MRFFISWSKIRWPSACTRHIHLITLWVRAKKSAPATRPLRLGASCAPFGTVARIYTAIMSCTTIRDVRLFFQTRREKILRMRLFCIVSRKKSKQFINVCVVTNRWKKCVEWKWNEHYFPNVFFIITLSPVCISEYKKIVIGAKMFLWLFC